MLPPVAFTVAALPAAFRLGAATPTGGFAVRIMYVVGVIPAEYSVSVPTVAVLFDT